MSKPFLLDKNVIIFAAKLEDENGEADITCSTLLLNILKKCHQLVLSGRLQSELYRMLKELGRTSVNIPKLLNLAYSTQNKVKFIEDENVPPLPNEDELHIKDEDLPLARIANYTGAIFVTTDRPLIDKLRKIGVTVYSPEEALRYLEETTVRL